MLYLRKPMVRIRKALKEDMVAVHALIRELAIYEREPNAVLISPEDLMQHGFSEQRFECFIAVDLKFGIIGMAFIETAVKSSKSKEKWVKFPSIPK